MPAKRIKAKARSHRITLEALDAFREAVKHQQTYFECVGGGDCRSSHRRRHCEGYRTYIESSSLLDQLLGIKPWEASPLDVESEDDADIHGNGAWKASVPQALKLREELIKTG